MEFFDLGDGGQIPCPWHADTDPSLKIYDDGYYCFGKCARQFTVIHLVMKEMDLPFPAALDWIEKNFGVDTTIAAPQKERIQAEQMDLWLEYDAAMAKILTPFIYETEEARFEKALPHVQKMYRYWDALVREAREVGASPTKVFHQASQDVRDYMERHVR